MPELNPREMQQALAQPFAPEDLEWRLQNTIEDKMRGMAVPYVTNRAIQYRLDDVVGVENWYNRFKPWHKFVAKVPGKEDYRKLEDKEIISQLCGIAIYFAERKKWDGAELSEIEPVKGGLSDSMKRAAYQWGIGRVLYDMNTVWVDIEKKGKTWFIRDDQRQKLDNAYLKLLDRLGGAAGAQGHPGAGGRRSAPGRTGLCPKRPGPGAEAGRGLFHAAGRTICGPKGQHGQG
mgnify:CR=1 FL=1